MLNNNDFFNIFIKIIEDKIASLEAIEISYDGKFEKYIEEKINIEKIRDDILSDFKKIVDNKNKLDKKQTAKFYSVYERFDKRINSLYSDLNYAFLDSGIQLKKEIETNINELANKINQDSKKTLPQIISFSSLFVAVVGLIISNITTSVENFSIKYILITNLTFVFAITLIFYFFFLLWSDLLITKKRKAILFWVFPIALITILTSLILIGIFM